MSHSVFKCGDHGSYAVAGDEQQGVVGERRDDSSVDCHKHFCATASLVGSNSGAARCVSVHSRVALHDADQSQGDVIPPTSQRFSSLPSEANSYQSNDVRGEPPREIIDESRWTDSRHSSASLFGHFPKLPRPRCANIQPWKPRTFAREVSEPIPDAEFIGVEHGLITPIRRIQAGRNKRKGYVLCQCRCGNTAEIEASKVYNGTRRTCGATCSKRDELPRVVHSRDILEKSAQKRRQRAGAQ